LRKRLWLQFHLWTIAVIALLSVANIASALRPYAFTQNLDITKGLLIGQSNVARSMRSPASETDKNNSANRLALKTARVGCETASRLRLLHAVRQLRLQFDACTGGISILGIRNKTNGFEATLFGAANSNEPEIMAGTFTAPETATKPSAVIAGAKNKRKIATENIAPQQEAISTDYISLAEGENEITIRRIGREQILKIERR
jgi:hypothetical protein